MVEFIESVGWEEEKNLSLDQHVAGDILHESRSLSPFSILGYIISSYEQNLITIGASVELLHLGAIFFFFSFSCTKDVFLGSHFFLK